MAKRGLIMKNKLNMVIIAATQSKWTRPALMMLALLLAVLGVVGCEPHH